MNAFFSEYGEFVATGLMGLALISGLSYILNALVIG